MKTITGKASSTPSRRAMIAMAGLAVTGAAVGLSKAEAAAKPKPMLMFVQLSEGIKVDEPAKTIRLVNLNPSTLYFADRPVRIAGHVKLATYLEEWTSKAGKDNFKGDPPNATLSVFEAGSTDATTTVIEITNPKMDGHDLVYGYKVIEGKLPAVSGETALFVDWIGVGGGVGVGFHGVGVGFRGPGFR